MLVFACMPACTQMCVSERERERVACLCSDMRFPISASSPTTNVYTATPLPTSITILLPFQPSLHHFLQCHQGLASWCLHCKSGLTIRRWLDPTHIQKHLIYLFIFTSSRASRCVIFDQGDIPTSKCNSLHQQVNLLTNKPKQDGINEILMEGGANDRKSTEKRLMLFLLACIYGF